MKVLLACVTSELGSYARDFAAQVRQACVNQHEIKLQEDFEKNGSPLAEIAAWIRECDVVIHLVGEAFGARPSTGEISDLFAFLGEAPPAVRADYSCVQWEFEVAQRLGRRTLAYIAAPDAPRDCGSVVQSEDDARLQAAHRERIQSSIACPTFSSSRKLNDLIFRDLGAAFLFGPPHPESPRSAAAMPSFSVMPPMPMSPPRPPAPTPALPPPVLHEQFRCSAFYADRIDAKSVGRIVASIHLESVATEVVREAARRLDLAPGTRMKAGSSRPSAHLSRDSRVDITPDIPGLVFDVTQAGVSLWNDQQFVEFRYKAAASAIGQLCRGWIHFWLEGVILADVEVAILVEADDVPDIFREALAESNARPYRFVFPSYSHEDKEAVERLEAYAESFGDTYLRDVKKLRAGQQWNAELNGFIRKADVFQLFWSNNAARSKYVESEWQNALIERHARTDPYFVRPIYWTDQPEEVPDPLMSIHFARVPLIRS